MTPPDPPEADTSQVPEIPENDNPIDGPPRPPESPANVTKPVPADIHTYGNVELLVKPGVKVLAELDEFVNLIVVIAL